MFETTSGHEPLQFIIGKGQVIKGLEEAVVGMNPGESKTARITADKAYGPFNKELIKVVGREQFPEDFKPEIGM